MFLKLQDVHNRFALGCTAKLREFVNLQPVQSTHIREEEQIRMGRGNSEVAHEIFFAGRHTLGTTAAATLRAIERDRITLDISEMGQRDDHVLFDNQVFVRDPIDRLSELCSALIPVFRFDFAKLVDHDLENALVRREQSL